LMDGRWMESVEEVRRKLGGRAEERRPEPEKLEVERELERRVEEVAPPPVEEAAPAPPPRIRWSLGSLGERTGALLDSVSMGTLGLWNRKRVVLPLFLLLSLLGWFIHYQVGTLLTFDLAVTLTVLFLVILLVGTVVIGGIEEGSIPFERVRRVTAGTLVAIGVTLLLLVYLALMLAKVAPPPPLPFLFAILFAMEVAPWIALALILPPILGYFLFRERWRRLRARKPFWGAYLGLLAAFFFLYPILGYPQLWFYGGFKFFVLAGAAVICSVLLLTHPREGVCKATGLALPLLGFLSWFFVYGGMALGSVLAILAGALAYSWVPREVSA